MPLITVEIATGLIVGVRTAERAIQLNDHLSHGKLTNRGINFFHD